jgi:hypothetical protein
LSGTETLAVPSRFQADLGICAPDLLWFAARYLVVPELLATPIYGLPSEGTSMKPLLIAVLSAIGLTISACTVTRTVVVTQSAPASPPATPAASQPAASPTATTPAASAGCLTRYLNGSIGLTQGVAGSVMVVLRFKNLNNVPCTLYGYPGVAQAGGRPVTDIGQPSTENPSTARELVTLPPGGYANATLQIVDAANYPTGKCQPVKADWLAVIPPNQRIPLPIHYTSTACKGNVQLLSVTAVRPGNGG